jgi:hypothetical protein
MQAPQIYVSPAETATPSDKSLTDHRRSRTSTEQFAAIMGRVLIPPDDAEDPSESSRQPSRDRDNSDRLQPMDPADAVGQNVWVGADGVAPQNPLMLPLDDQNPSSAGSPPAGTGSSDNPASGTGKDTATAPGASAGLAPGATASPGSLAETLRSMTPAEDGTMGGEPGPAMAGGAAGSAGARAAPGKDAAPGAEVAGWQGATGISSAQQQTAMQKAAKMNELSALAEQNLPVSPAGNTGEELPATIPHPVNSVPRRDKSEPSATSGSLATGAASPDSATFMTTAASHGPATAPARSLERALDLMSLHTVRLRESGADSLQVVIKPGPDLHLSLHLQMRDGTVEMHAHLHRGDFEFLSKHWSELQQQLELRGVRLTSLTCGEPSTGGGQQLFQQPGRPFQDNETAPPGGAADLAIAGVLKPTAATRTRTLRGWESWA